jgi:transposase-like protein
MDKNTYYKQSKIWLSKKVLNQYCSNQDPSRPALKKLLEDLLDWFMMSEREIYLMKNDNDKGNGFYNRKLATPVGNLESFPRTRTGEFRPNILLKPMKGLMNHILNFLCPLLLMVTQNLLS